MMPRPKVGSTPCGCNTTETHPARTRVRRYNPPQDVTGERHTRLQAPPPTINPEIGGDSLESEWFPDIYLVIKKIISPFLKKNTP